MWLQKIHRIGHSLMLVLNKGAARELHVTKGSLVVVKSLHDGTMTIEAWDKYVGRTRAHRADPPRPA